MALELRELGEHREGVRSRSRAGSPNAAESARQAADGERTRDAAERTRDGSSREASLETSEEAREVGRLALLPRRLGGTNNDGVEERRDADRAVDGFDEASNGPSDDGEAVDRTLERADEASESEEGEGAGEAEGPDEDEGRVPTRTRDEVALVDPGGRAPRVEVGPNGGEGETATNVVGLRDVLGWIGFMEGRERVSMRERRALRCREGTNSIPACVPR